MCDEEKALMKEGSNRLTQCCELVNGREEEGTKEPMRTQHFLLYNFRRDVIIVKRQTSA
jgi:hypothetical protein